MQYAAHRLVFEAVPDGQYLPSAWKQTGQSANYMQHISLIKIAVSHGQACIELLCLSVRTGMKIPFAAA